MKFIISAHYSNVILKIYKRDACGSGAFSKKNFSGTSPQTPIVKWIKWILILEATHRVPARSAAATHAGTAADEVEAEGAGAINRTAPIGAAGPNIAERTIAVVAVARHGQFQRGSKGTGCIITTPICALCI